MKKGFGLIGILISVGIIAIVFGAGFYYSQNFTSSTNNDDSNIQNILDDAEDVKDLLNDHNKDIDKELISEFKVQGRVLLGPICPVMKEIPDPNCADKGYKTTVKVIEIGSPKSSPFLTAESDENGFYELILPVGEYALHPIGGSPLPFCDTKEISIVDKDLSETNLSCDTGIR